MTRIHTFCFFLVGLVKPGEMGLHVIIVGLSVLQICSLSQVVLKGVWYTGRGGGTGLRGAGDMT